MNKPEPTREGGVTRRDFIKGSGLLAAGAAIGFPAIVPSTVFGQNAPSNRIGIGFIGIGRQAYGANLPPMLESADVAVLAVCDVDAWRMEQGRQRVEGHYAQKSAGGTYRGCAAYQDFRDLLARPDIDAVMISTPDHWHVPMALAAVAAGKDVSCEKPLTLSIAEGRRLADAVKRHGRVFRTDSEFRSSPDFYRIAGLVRAGRIGNLQKIYTGVPKTDLTIGPQPEMPVPEELDFDFWLGPVAARPYNVQGVHTPHDLKSRPGWMRVRDTCEGMVTNWGTHLNDIAQWGNRTDRGGPIEVEAKGTYPPAGNFWDVLLGFEAHYRYANGVTLDYVMDRPFIRFEGDEGWVEVDYEKPGVTASAESILAGEIDYASVDMPPRKHEKRDFIDAVKSRGATLEDAEVGHRTCSICQIAHVAIQLGGEAGMKLAWDPEKEVFDNEAANRLKDRPAWREPWTLDTMEA